MTLQTLRFLRALCDQVRPDPQTSLVSADQRAYLATLWQAADELDTAIAHETGPATNGAREVQRVAP